MSQPQHLLATKPPRWWPTEAPALYSQDGAGYGALVYAHYFVGSHDWLVTEYDPDTHIAFGWACLGGDRSMAELGYTSMDELAALRIRVDIGGATGAVGIDREDPWTPVPLSEAIALLDRRQGRG